MSEALAHHYPPQLVPADYAEKAMASLMQLHSELMEEKERRVDLFRRLMEREQAVAELRMYVKVLEERVAAPPPPQAERPTPEPGPARVSEGEPAPHRRPARFEFAGRPSASAHVNAPMRPPVPPRVGGRREEGWRVW